jgi:hypothetical protein
MRLSLVAVESLDGGFVTSQAIYADNERIFAGSYQGDLFVLARDREEFFPVLQTIHLNSAITGVRGDQQNVYVSAVNGVLYTFSKSWPLQLSTSTTLSQYGLAAVGVASNHVYAAKGQAAMAVSNDHIFLSALNAGDTGIDVSTMQTYGDKAAPGVTSIFNRENLVFTGAITNPPESPVNLGTWNNFLFVTTPGCCGTGISVYDTGTMSQVQFIARTTNTVSGVERRGVSMLVGGSETGLVDLYTYDGREYNLIDSSNLGSLTGFEHPEDIEIRSLWVDGLDNLIFAGSSWGNDNSRRPGLPSFFILEIANPQYHPRPLGRPLGRGGN